MASRPYNGPEIVRAIRGTIGGDLGKTAFAILKNVVFGSPVGNPTLWQNPGGAPVGYVGGHFRRNWIVTIGGFSTGEIEGVDVAGATTVSSGKAVIDRYSKMKRNLGVNLIIQNNVPYANRLAQGWSRQAAAGWVDAAIDAALIIPGGAKPLP